MHSRVRKIDIWIVFWCLFAVGGFIIDVDIVFTTGLICATVWQAKKS